MSDLEVIIPDHIRAEMAADPELAAALKNFFAACRQADHAVRTGQHASFDDAMEAITGMRPEPVVFEEE